MGLLCQVFTRHYGVRLPWSVHRTLMHSWKLVRPLIRPRQHSTVRLGRISGAALCVTRHTLEHGIKESVRFYSDDNYRRSHPKPQDNEEPDPRESWSWSQLLPGVLVGILYFLASSSHPIPEVPFPFFLQQMLNTGEVSKLEVNHSHNRVYIYLYPGAIINGQEIKPHGPQFIMSISGINSFEEKVSEAQDQLGIPSVSRVKITYKRSSETASILISGLITLTVVYGVWSFITKRYKISAGSITFDSSGLKNSILPKSRFQEASHITTKFSDVAGMGEAKQEVMEFVDYLKNPERFTRLGARIPRGALLYGPPGTGKTLLAKAIAGESNVPFTPVTGSEFVEKYAGQGSANVRELFKSARERAPCILFIDEIDAVGRSRSAGPTMESNIEHDSTLNQLLVELDGIAPLEGVIVLASTNRVDILDEALLRPGRFDRQIAIDLPTLSERKEIFEVYLKKLALEKTFEKYSSRLASLTPGRSGADIANIVNEAAIHAARELGSQVTDKNFEYAIERVLAGMEKRGGVISPEERKVTAYHEAGHALIGWLLEHTDPVLKVSITPRTKGILGYTQHLPSDLKLRTSEQIFDLMCMTLGGRVAEAIAFRKVTTGAKDDLERVTDMAYKQVVEFGMSPTIGNISLPMAKRNEPTKRFYSDKLASLIDEEVRQIVNKAYTRTETVLRNDYKKLEQLAESLLEKEVLNYEDIVAVLGPLPHNKTARTHLELQDMW